jgi:hypothetical protein
MLCWNVLSVYCLSTSDGNIFCVACHFPNENRHITTSNHYSKYHKGKDAQQKYSEEK